MAITLLDNLNLPNSKPKIVGDIFATVDEMMAYNENYLPSIRKSFVEADGSEWKYDRSNEFITPATATAAGKWRKTDSGEDLGDGKVKMDSQSVFNYLGEWIDKSSIVNENGILKAKILDGMQCAVAEVNFLKGLKSNVQEQIDTLSKITTNYGIFDTKAELDQASVTKAPTENQLALIRTDETKEDKQTSYIFVNNQWIFWAYYTLEIRDFTTDPIDLTTEVTGILPEANIDAAIARTNDVLDKATYAGATEGVVKKAEEIDGISKSDIQDAIDKKHEHANKDAIDKIITTGDGDKFLNDHGDYVKISGGGASIASDVSYTNAGHLDWDNVQKALDGIIDKIEYVKPSITTFTITPSATDYEIGQSVTDLIFNWAYNKAVKTQSLTDAILVDETVRTSSWSGNLTSNKTFTLAASDGTNSVSASKTINFKHKIYYGVAALPGEFNSAFILGLANKNFATSYKGTYSVNAGAGQYAFVACPASWNMPNTCKIGGFGTDLIDCGTIQFTNASGNTTNFKIVRTSQANLGSISMLFE